MARPPCEERSPPGTRLDGPGGSKQRIPQGPRRSKLGLSLFRWQPRNPSTRVESRQSEGPCPISSAAERRGDDEEDLRLHAELLGDCARTRRIHPPELPGFRAGSRLG